jgi:hypothetical protein
MGVDIQYWCNAFCRQIIFFSSQVLMSEGSRTGLDARLGMRFWRSVMGRVMTPSLRQSTQIHYISQITLHHVENVKINLLASRLCSPIAYRLPPMYDLPYDSIRGLVTSHQLHGRFLFVVVRSWDGRWKMMPSSVVYSIPRHTSCIVVLYFRFLLPLIPYDSFRRVSQKVISNYYRQTATAKSRRLRSESVFPPWAKKTE